MAMVDESHKLEQINHSVNPALIILNLKRSALALFGSGLETG